MAQVLSAGIRLVENMLDCYARRDADGLQALLHEDARHTTPGSDFGTDIVGAAAIALSWHGPLRDDPLEEVETSGKVLWMLVFAALGGWELTNLFLQPSLSTDSWAHPTISVLSDPMLGSRIWRSFFLLVWLRIGWGLLKR